ncbi:hypothetical protein Pa4123_25400 [Phytohabitans aurantiacus]|uniref:Uncharacterized protein n=1 Tax=Phytohabitans aurantiacus TaxID=3016789 RepID=A0ABQ5QSK0_9ACTN|nr:hypothetical protein Pa4123_25400 [Phytohabitans aurantiacus]
MDDAPVEQRPADILRFGLVEQAQRHVERGERVGGLARAHVKQTPLPRYQTANAFRQVWCRVCLVEYGESVRETPALGSVEREADEDLRTQARLGMPAQRTAQQPLCHPVPAVLGLPYGLPV